MRFKYACHACEGSVVLSPLPAQPIGQGEAGAGTARPGRHGELCRPPAPHNRQVDIFPRHGVNFSRQTLCDWGAAAADLLEPIY